MAFLDKLKSILTGGRLDVQGRFELVREAISGTMSKFYLARDRKTGELYGLKILDLEKTAAFESRCVGLKKPSEGEVSLKLVHPRLVKTFAAGLTTDGQAYVLMEYLEGPGMNSVILERSGKLRGKRLPLLVQMAEGLRAVHTAGFIHRDICPRNFICSKDLDSVKLIDFGLTVPATKEYMSPGNRTGTPNYMAPEILRRRSTDHRTDIFSLGVTMYQLCAFQLPWPTQDVTAKAAVLHDTRKHVDIQEICLGINPRLAKLIDQCLSVEPTERPATCDMIHRALLAMPSEGEF
ncbi:MAG: serine/threonine-protein kinase [Planctomycetota bacterium]|nr:serine/threonine-protein kinase [Planctomycetota bacterium]